jgi:ureidoacrylate peracid hydrolase
MAMVDFAADPQRTALINVDMQNCFVENSPFASREGPALLGRINRLADACRSLGVTIIHTAHVIRPDRSNLGVLGDILPVVKTGVLDEGSFSAALHKDLDVRPTDIILYKPRYGSFHGTDLELILHSKAIDTVIICGLTTNCCCETTAREANARDFKVFFLSDGTAAIDTNGISAEELQRVTCATVGALYAQVLTIDQILAKLRAGGATAARAAE